MVISYSHRLIENSWKRFRCQTRRQICSKMYKVLSTVTCNIFPKCKLNPKHSLYAFMLSYTHLYRNIIEKLLKMSPRDRKVWRNFNIHAYIHTYRIDFTTHKNGFRDPPNVKLYQYFHNRVFIILSHKS